MSVNLIQPQKNFAFVRQIPDPSDSTTYYVQAEIRYAETDTLIERVNLTDKGNRRFVGVWRAIADKSGQGVLISVRTTVYTDSNYSTPSTTYMQEMETYLVMQQFNPREIVQILGPALFERGSGPDISYKKIREILGEELTQKLAPISASIEEIDTTIEIPRNLVTHEDLRKIESKLLTKEDVRSCIPEIPEQKEIDLSPLLKKIEDSVSTLGDSLGKVLEIVKDKPDLEPIKKMLDKMEVGDTEAYEQMKEIFEDNVPEILKDFEKLQNMMRDVFIYLMAIPKTPVDAPKTKSAEDRAREILDIK